jgi:uncharacterized protein (TIGR03000 family)
MYSLILMTAMAGTTEAPQFGGRILHGCHGGLFGIRAHLFHGCHGCWGSSCHGCWGAPVVVHGCWGSSCHGCWGSSCHGCWGSSCHGCFGGHAVLTAPPVYTFKTVGTAKTLEDDTGVAQIQVEVPFGAKLYVDGKLVEGSGSTRNFHTPALPVRKQYFYDMKAVIDVNGKPMEEIKVVKLQAGMQVNANFGQLIAAVAKSSAEKLAAK